MPSPAPKPLDSPRPPISVQVNSPFLKGLGKYSKIFWQSRLGPCIVIALVAFVLGSLFGSNTSADRDGYGMAMMGLAYFGAPFCVALGALAFIFRRTIVASILNGFLFFFGVLFLVLMRF